MKEQTRAPHGAVRRIASLGAAVLAAIGLTFGVAAPALAHDELTGRTFTSNTDGQSDGVVLSFSNEIMAVGTEIVVSDAAGTSIVEGAPEIVGRDVTQALVTPLKTGENYRVIWRVVSSDGHPIQGEYYFEVDANGVAAVSATAEPAPRFEGEEDAQEQVEDEVATTESASAEQSSFPVGGWIAIGAVVVLGAAAAVLFAAKKRKTADAAAKTNDVEETN